MKNHFLNFIGKGKQQKVINDIDLIQRSPHPIYYDYLGLKKRFNHFKNYSKWFTIEHTMKQILSKLPPLNMQVNRLKFLRDEHESKIVREKCFHSFISYKVMVLEIEVRVVVRYIPCKFESFINDSQEIDWNLITQNKILVNDKQNNLRYLFTHPISTLSYQRIRQIIQLVAVIKLLGSEGIMPEIKNTYQSDLVICEDFAFYTSDYYQNINEITQKEGLVFDTKFADLMQFKQKLMTFDFLNVQLFLKIDNIGYNQKSQKFIFKSCKNCFSSSFSLIEDDLEQKQQKIVALLNQCITSCIELEKKSLKNNDKKFSEYDTIFTLAFQIPNKQANPLRILQFSKLFYGDTFITQMFWESYIGFYCLTKNQKQAQKSRLKQFRAQFSFDDLVEQTNQLVNSESLNQSYHNQICNKNIFTLMRYLHYKQAKNIQHLSILKYLGCCNFSQRYSVLLLFQTGQFEQLSYFIKMAKSLRDYIRNEDYCSYLFFLQRNKQKQTIFQMGLMYVNKRSAVISNYSLINSFKQQLLYKLVKHLQSNKEYEKMKTLRLFCRVLEREFRTCNGKIQFLVLVLTQILNLFNILSTKEPQLQKSYYLGLVHLYIASVYKNTSEDKNYHSSNRHAYNILIKSCHWNNYFTNQIYKNQYEYYQQQEKIQLSIEIQRILYRNIFQQFDFQKIYFYQSALPRYFQIIVFKNKIVKLIAENKQSQFCKLLMVINCPGALKLSEYSQYDSSIIKSQSVRNLWKYYFNHDFFFPLQKSSDQLFEQLNKLSTEDKTSNRIYKYIDMFLQVLKSLISIIQDIISQINKYFVFEKQRNTQLLNTYLKHLKQRDEEIEEKLADLFFFDTKAKNAYINKLKREIAAIYQYLSKRQYYESNQQQTLLLEKIKNDVLELEKMERVLRDQNNL